jgi:hypothetical protein
MVLQHAWTSSAPRWSRRLKKLGIDPRRASRPSIKYAFCIRHLGSCFFLDLRPLLLTGFPQSSTSVEIGFASPRHHPAPDLIFSAKVSDLRDIPKHFALVLRLPLPSLQKM